MAFDWQAPHDWSLYRVFDGSGVLLYVGISTLALPILANGRRTSAKALVEMARYSHAAFAPVGSEFKIDNSIVSRLSRALMDEFPELAGVFTTRELRS